MRVTNATLCLADESNSAKDLLFDIFADIYSNTVKDFLIIKSNVETIVFKFRNILGKEIMSEKISGKNI